VSKKQKQTMAPEGSVEPQEPVELYKVSVTKWEHGKGRTEAMPEGPVRDIILASARTAMDIFPSLTEVTYRAKEAGGEQITVYRKEAPTP